MEPIAPVQLLFKVCYVCGESKSLNFFNNRSPKYRFLYDKDSACRECAKIRTKAWREANPEKVKAYYPKQVEAILRYMGANRVKVNARLRAARANLRKDKCESCGNSEDLHMHHPDYNKPLEVVTLCRNCHEYEHHT